MNDNITPESHQAALTREALAAAAAHHAAGQFELAEELYRAILAVQPDHADANFNLGLMAMQLDQARQALPFFQAALAARQDQEAFWIAYVKALSAAGEHDAARDALALGVQHGLSAEVVVELSPGRVQDVSKRKSVAKATHVRKTGKASGIEEITAIASLFQARRFAEAEIGARHLTQRAPRNGHGWNLLGAALIAQGRCKEALVPMQKATVLLPTNALAQSNLGNTWRELGHPVEALASYDRALKIDPNCAEAHNNRGLALRDLGQMEHAVASYRRALEIRADYVIALNNLGAALLDVCQFEEAERWLKQAVRLQPDSGMALNNLALVLKAEGKTSEAMNVAARSVGISDTVQAKQIFVDCVRHIQLKWVGPDLRAKLFHALSAPWGRPTDLAPTCTALVKNTPGIAVGIARAIVAWPRRLAAGDLFATDDLANSLADPLLNALLVSAPICDMEIERFLTTVRYALLEIALGTVDASLQCGTSLEEFSCALARQCFVNEYVFSWTDDEMRNAERLKELLVAALAAGTPVPVLWAPVVGAYFPLHQLPSADRLLSHPCSDAFAAVLTLQVREPREELALRQTLPRWSGVDDATSQQVQRQYEQNPYPRWVKTVPAERSTTIDKYLRQIFPLGSFRPLGKGSEVDILIAGCGTGQQTVEVANTYPDARIVAVDLSTTSLCYSKRKTQDANVTSVEYAQADILELGALERRFDVIMSTGVLHHLADPLAGWRVLLSLLRPGGFMNLGFYSETARRDVVRVRSFIQQRGYRSSVEDIRRCRQDLIDLDAEEHWGAVTKSADFFSISGCRDLIFHVQEHRTTLDAIADFLEQNSLQFIGFALPPGTVQAYQRRFPADPAGANLAFWKIFEQENPDTFWGMYQFWVQKAA